MKMVGMALLAGFLAGCAQSPESVQPSYVSEVGYRSWSCKDLVEERERLNGAIAQGSLQQNDVQAEDAVGVLLFGLPTASMSLRDLAPYLARLKGEAAAIDRTTDQKKCPGRT